jgi:hypothetical protein
MESKYELNVYTTVLNTDMDMTRFILDSVRSMEVDQDCPKKVRLVDEWEQKRMCVTLE